MTKKELRQREQGFDLSCTSEKLPSYNALFDRNLRHHFENRGTCDANEPLICDQIKIKCRASNVALCVASQQVSRGNCTTLG